MGPAGARQWWAPGLAAETRSRWMPAGVAGGLQVRIAGLEGCGSGVRSGRPPRCSAGKPRRACGREVQDGLVGTSARQVRHDAGLRWAAEGSPRAMELPQSGRGTAPPPPEGQCIAPSWKYRPALKVWRVPVSRRDMRPRSGVALSRSRRKTAGNLRLSAAPRPGGTGCDETGWSSGGDRDMKFSGWPSVGASQRPCRGAGRRNPCSPAARFAHDQTQIPSAGAHEPPRGGSPRWRLTHDRVARHPST